MLKNSLLRSLLGKIVIALWVPLASQAAAPAADIPVWLQEHIGTGEGEIAPVVLERARALYLKNRETGKVSNPCYLAMDATRPSTAPTGEPGSRFYVICEADKSFRAVSSGYGNGRRLRNADFSNGRECAKNFSNAEGSKLTMGGAYTTAETRTSFKGYITRSGTKVPFYRTFLLFDGDGETENARERAIGGHPAVFVKWQCRLKKPESPNANEEGYVPYGNLVNYTGGRSNGCTTWSPAVSEDIVKLVDGEPTTLYIYPEGRDIDAVANAVSTGASVSKAGLYWNASCLSAIGAPKFWPKQALQPVINNWRQSLPDSPPRDLPICK